MKKLVCIMLVLCLSSMAFATSIYPLRTSPNQEIASLLTARDGTADGVFTGPDPSGALIYVGDRYAGDEWDAGVMKFDIAGAGYNAGNAASITGANIMGY